MLAPLLAFALASVPPGLHSESQNPPGAVPGDEDYVYSDDEHHGGARRLRLEAIGGTLYDVDDPQWIPFGGGQVAWAFSSVDVGVFGGAYRFGRIRTEGAEEWGPVILARLEQRFDVSRNTEAILGLGIGAAREKGWGAWFQFGFGFRFYAGPLFVGGELGFEQDNLFRMGATAGIAVF